MSEFCVLVVEDEPDGADVVVRMLKAVGVKTVVATSGEAALAELETHPNDFTCAIVDLALPQMDGFELMNVIRSEPSVQNLPLVAITAYHTPELKVKALESGFDAYFAKPLDTNLFMQALEKLVGA
jgi:CheY-like chemotaxis protein